MGDTMYKKNINKYSMMHSKAAARFFLYAGILLISVIYIVTGCTDIQNDKFGIRALYDMPYIDDGFDKHCLDLFLPQSPAEGFPIIVFVHGGGWHWGDRKGLVDVYGDLGRAWARAGIAVAVISYRLGDDYPIEIQLSDVAAAIAWVWRKAAEYGADPTRFFVCGHSVGAHMTAMTALDPSWLKKQGLSPDILTGVILWSGLYDVPGAIPMAGWLGRRKIWYPVFGKNPVKWKAMSPVSYIKREENVRTSTKFLIIRAEDDMDVIEVQSNMFYQKLLAQGYRVNRTVLEGEGHYFEVLDADDPQNQMFQEVISFTAMDGPDH